MKSCYNLRDQICILLRRTLLNTLCREIEICASHSKSLILSLYPRIFYDTKQIHFLGRWVHKEVRQKWRRRKFWWWWDGTPSFGSYCAPPFLWDRMHQIIDTNLVILCLFMRIRLDLFTIPGNFFIWFAFWNVLELVACAFRFLITCLGGFIFLWIWWCLLY